MSSSQSAQASRRARGAIPLEDLAFQERDSVFRAPSGGDWLLLGLVTVGLLGTGLYDWLRLGVNDHTGRAVFFGLALVAVFWSALVYIFKLSMCVLVGPRGISLARGPWRTELPWRDTARLVERTHADGDQRFRWVVALARDGRQLRVREDMVIDYMRFRAEVYERYLLWRDHGGTWGASGSGPFSATDMVANTVAWWLFAGAMALLPGVYFWFLLPETGLTGLALVGITVLCCLVALGALLGRQTYTVGPKEITRKRPLQPTTHLFWRNVSRIDRTRHPAGGLIPLGIATGQGILALAARTDSRFQSFAWSPRVPEYLILRGEGRHVRIRLHRLARPDEMLAWVEYYERIGRRREASQSRPRAAAHVSHALRGSQPPVASRPAARSASAPVGVAPGDDLFAAFAGASASGPIDPWADGHEGALTADAYPTEIQPSVGAGRPSAHPSPAQRPLEPGMPPAVAAAFAASDDQRPEGDSWLWDTSKMPKIAGGSSSSNIFGRPSARPSAQPPRVNPESLPPTPTFTPPPTGGPAFMPPAPAAPNTGAASESPAGNSWWLTGDAPAPASPSWDAAASWEAANVYPPVNYADAPNFPPDFPPAPVYPSAHPPHDSQQTSQQAADDEPEYPQRMPPFVQRPDDSQAAYSEPPEEQGQPERELYDENLEQSQRWRDQQNWQPPQLPRFGPQEGKDDMQRQ